MIRPPPRSPLFPSTTLFRSHGRLRRHRHVSLGSTAAGQQRLCRAGRTGRFVRSEEHTSELQSQSNLVCRLLLEKKKNTTAYDHDEDPMDQAREASPYNTVM